MLTVLAVGDIEKLFHTMYQFRLYYVGRRI